MFDLFKKWSKYISFVFLALVAFALAYCFSSFVSDCANGEKALSILDSLCDVLCWVAVLALSIIGIVMKKDKLLFALIGFTLITRLWNGFFNLGDFFAYISNATSDYFRAISKTYYAFNAIMILAVFGFAICFFLVYLLKTGLAQKIGTCLGLAVILLSVIKFILMIVCIADGVTEWYGLFFSFCDIIYGCWFVLAINHPKLLGNTEEKQD